MSGQLSKRALKKLKKKIDVEYDSRTDITGHFKSEYDQGFCDGADWVFKLAEKEPVSPSLTDDQQVVLEWLKESCNADDYTTPMLAIYKLYSSQQMVPNLVFLTTEKQFQVLAVFAEWGLKEDNQ